MLNDNPVYLLFFVVFCYVKNSSSSIANLYLDSRILRKEYFNLGRHKEWWHHVHTKLTVSDSYLLVHSSFIFLYCWLLTWLRIEKQKNVLDKYWIFYQYRSLKYKKTGIFFISIFLKVWFCLKDDEFYFLHHC